MVLLVGALLLALGLGVSLLRETAHRAGPAGQSGGSSSSVASAGVGGPFRLVDQNGRAANESLLKGRWTALFFGYTFCPDVCPATLSELKLAKARLGPQGANLQVVFVTIDPERDTPAQLRRYLSTDAFPHPITGLTGTPAQIAAVAKAYKVYYAKDGTGPDYKMAHSSGVYLIDPQGRFRTLVSDGAGLDNMVAEMADTIRRG